MKRAVERSLTITISVCFLLPGIFVFRSSYLRLYEACSDLCRSIGFYVCEIFKTEHGIMPTVTQYSTVMGWEMLLPEDFEGFKEKAHEYILLLFSKENFIAWAGAAGKTLGIAAKAASILLPCVFVLWFVLKQLYARGNNRQNADTLPLRAFKRLTAWFAPVKKAGKDYLLFLRTHQWIRILWLILWLFHLNAVSIVVAALAYYFYFAAAFDIVNLYVQFCKLMIDLQVLFRYFPWWILAVGGYWLFNRARKRIAVGRLRHYEARNCGFIKELPIVSLACGSMGKKKTTLITDMALSQEVMFRQQAWEILRDADLKFPYFPWLAFETELRQCMEHGTVYNLATIKEWVKLKKARYLKHGDADRQLYGYDVLRNSTAFDDALKAEGLFQVMETYAQAFFIYVVESSLIVSNYSIRTDNRLIDGGNFPLWSFDFFPEQHKTDSRYSHILDFDILRLGKKVAENNPRAGSFEFGVIAISEIGKERGNNLELREVRKGTEETNQKNDLFNAWLKMCRHSATVDHFPFIKVFTDEQRPESWGADARDLCDVIHIEASDKQRLALPCYTIEEMISEWVFNKFISLYYDFRFRRGDNTLLVYVLKGITAWLWRRNLRIYNRYGYNVLRLEKERGTMNGNTVKRRYYLMNRKIYAKRFSTDCFSDYFNDMAKRSKCGLMDYLEYMTEKATVEELKMQNSYFINALYKDPGEKSGSA